MLEDIVSIRREVKMVPSSLRQGKPVPAIKAVVNALKLTLTAPLMKSERDELVNSIRGAIDYINNDPMLRELYPLSVTYAQGEEKETFAQLVELLKALNEVTMSEVAHIKLTPVQIEDAVAEGLKLLEAGEKEKALEAFRAVNTRFPEDAALKIRIGDLLFAAGLYEDAVKYFEEAVALDPIVLPYHNRLAITLRKLGRYEESEEKYMAALLLAPEDPSLLFNAGRLYAEWDKWDRALQLGEKALGVDPGFSEAQKLVGFARKKLQ